MKEVDYKIKVKQVRNLFLCLKTIVALGKRNSQMVNAIKGVFITCDIPMAQFIVNMNNSMPSSQKFIIHVLDSTHLFVQPHVEQMIRSAVAEFRDQNSYEKPT
ncbi:TFIIH subunit TTDA/Tfb5 protein [Raphanus sativus]|nr:TFIIH subunit TTDA/Tfb5 protein [Raphanus sativus]